MPNAFEAVTFVEVSSLCVDHEVLLVVVELVTSFGHAVLFAEWLRDWQRVAEGFNYHLYSETSQKSRSEALNQFLTLMEVVEVKDGQYNEDECNPDGGKWKK